jgi:GDPmannose 4,6-dehydratase
VAHPAAPQPDTFILATGRVEKVRTFATLAFKAAGIDIEWVGRGREERGRCARGGRVLVEVDAAYYRPAEVDVLRGCATKAEQLLGWRPTTTLESLCSMMIDADMRRRGTLAVASKPELAVEGFR